MTTAPEMQPDHSPEAPANAPAPAPEITSRIAAAVQAIVTAIPASVEPLSADPAGRAKHLAYLAKAKAAGVAFGLAIPPGPLGMLTIIPDLIIVWRIQAQLVADIAAAHGKTAMLRQEAMLYCLFKHGGAQAAKDLMIRVGERVLVRNASLPVIQRVLQQVGIRVTQRVVGKGISRWIPLIGGGVVAAYAWYDTDQVASTASELFALPLALEGEQLALTTSG